MKLKDIKGFEGLYAITEDGRVWSHLNNKWLTPSNCYGYLQIGLTKERKQKKFLIHRLVYETFKGPIPEDLTVDHIDANRHNNHLINLQLLTLSDNTKKAHKGIPKSERWKKKASLAQKGKPKSLEWRKKISESVRRTKALRKLNA